MLATCSASPASIAALGSLCQDHAQLSVVSVLINVMHADMSLQVVGSGVAMLLVRAERTARPESVYAFFFFFWNRLAAYHMYPGL